MSDTTNLQPGSTTAAANPGTATEIIELDRPECLRLLAEEGIGRIAVNVLDWPQPVIRPVNYVFDQPSQSVLIRSGLGSKLYALIRSAKAAFEIDDVDPAGSAGA